MSIPVFLNFFQKIQILWAQRKSWQKKLKSFQICALCGKIFGKFREMFGLGSLYRTCFGRRNTGKPEIPKSRKTKNFRQTHNLNVHL